MTYVTSLITGTNHNSKNEIEILSRLPYRCRITIETLSPSHEGDPQFPPWVPLANKNRPTVPDTLEEYKLVFYGTETSLEFDDYLDRDKPGPPVNQQEATQDNTAIGARHNAVEAENGDPWTGSQQVERVSHPEVQRPTTENQTSGCSSLDAGRCLGGCLILLLLAYLTGGASWGELASSWQRPPSARSQLGASASGPASTTSSVRKYGASPAIDRSSAAPWCS